MCKNTQFKQILNQRLFIDFALCGSDGAQFRWNLVKSRMHHFEEETLIRIQLSGPESRQRPWSLSRFWGLKEAVEALKNQLFELNSLAIPALRNSAT